MLLAAVGWPDVALALVPTVAALAATYIANVNRKSLKTPSGTTIGKQVEDVNHTARSNWHTLDAVRRDVGITQSPQAARESGAVDGLKPDGED